MRREQVDELTGSQLGLITRKQALGCGMTEGQLRTRLETQRWTMVFRGVYRVCGAPVTQPLLVLAAVLAAGPDAVASHHAAAWVWGLADDLVLEVTIPRNRSSKLRRVVVHRQQLSPASISRRKGVPVTNPLRTLLDLAATSAGEVVDQALDRGTANHLFTDAAVKAELARQGRRGRHGVVRLRQVLEDRDDPSSRPASVLERRMCHLLRAARLPPPQREHRVLDGRCRVDFAWPTARLAVELDGYASHSSAQAFQADRKRQNDLVHAGWTVLRFTWDDVCRRPGEVRGHIRAALAASRPA